MNPAEISRRWLVCQIGLANLTHETSELNLPRLDLAADEIAYIHKPSFGCPGEPADEDHAKCPERARLRCEQQFVRIGQTQRPGPTAATKEPRAAQEVYLDEIAESSLPWLDPLGEEGHQRPDCQVLWPGIQRPPGLCEGEAGVDECGAVGSTPQQLLQPPQGFLVTGGTRSWRLSCIGVQNLPHAWRALKGWRRLAPGSSRRPILWLFGRPYVQKCDTLVSSIVHHDRTVSLHPTWRAAQMQGL